MRLQATVLCYLINHLNYSGLGKKKMAIKALFSALKKEGVKKYQKKRI
jgi:hypothetical protein